MCLAAFFSLAAYGADSVRVYQGFSGGMMLHTGYLYGSDAAAPCADVPLRGATFGIGGALRVHLWDHLRVGGEGFVSTMPAAATTWRAALCSGSYVRSGWGGVSADACWRGNKVWPYVGGSLGGGTMRSLYITEGDETDWAEEAHAVFHRQPFFYVDPYVGLDWCMTPRVHLTFRFDWLWALHRDALVCPTGPRLYVGFMFCH